MCLVVPRNVDIARAIGVARVIDYTRENYTKENVLLRSDFCGQSQSFSYRIQTSPQTKWHLHFGGWWRHFNQPTPGQLSRDGGY